MLCYWQDRRGHQILGACRALQDHIHLQLVGKIHAKWPLTMRPDLLCWIRDHFR